MVEPNPGGRAEARLKTYVINLPDAVRRRRLIEAQLVHFPFLDVEFFTAVRGADLAAEEIDRLADHAHSERHLGRRLTLSEIGCALSHLEIYGLMESAHVAQAMILEDDAIVSGMLHAFFPRLLAAFRSERPRILLLTPCKYMINGGRRVDEDYAIRPMYDASSTTGYMINVAAARILRGALLPLYTVADSWVEIRRSTGMRIETLVPYCIGISYSKNTASTVQATAGTETSRSAPAVHAARVHQRVGGLLRRAARGLFERAFGIKAHRVIF